MKVLAIETSSPMLGVALVDESAVLASYELLADRAHAAELPLAVERVLRAAGLSLRKLDGVAVSIGPGSFTGLRIGVAFVKALLAGVPKPLAGVPSLDVLATPLAWTPGRVCAVLDARQRNVYAAVYHAKDGRLNRQADYRLTTAAELAGSLAESREPVLLVGDGLAQYRDVFAEALGARARFAEPALWLPRAAVLGRLGRERLQQGQSDDPARLSPLYLYPLECTVRGPVAPAPASAPSA